MANVKDLRNFFKSAENKSDAEVPPFSAYGEISMINYEIKSYVQLRRYYKTMVREYIKNQVADYALIHGTKPAIHKFGKEYPEYILIQISINNWKTKLERTTITLICTKKGRPNLMEDKPFPKVKDMATGIHVTERVVSKRMLIAVSFVKANRQSRLKVCDGYLALKVAHDTY